MSPNEIMTALAEPFEAGEVKWKPITVKGNRALAIAFVDARLVQDRLDDVVGINNWQDDYDLAPDGSVTCRLTIRINNEWICKMDVGSPSEQPDSGDRLKAAFSDALKRAAVKFGIGRYLYRIHNQWVDYDPVKRQFTKTPTLPQWALPSPKTHTKNLAPYSGVESEPVALEPAKPAKPVMDAAAIETLKLLLKQKGVKWAEAIQAINDKFNTDYTPKHTPASMDAEHVIAYGQWLKQQPDAPVERDLDWATFQKNWATDNPESLTWDVIVRRTKKISSLCKIDFWAEHIEKLYPHKGDLIAAPVNAKEFNAEDAVLIHGAIMDYVDQKANQGGN